MASWFITKNGRLFTQTMVCAAAAGISGTCIAFKGPLLDTYQSFMQMYRYGMPKQLPPEVLQTADSVLNDCKEKKKAYVSEEKKNIRFFAAIGRDLFHAGCTRLPWGCIIGLPFTFGIKSKSNFDLLNLKVHGREDIDWFSEGDELLQSLILSENAQKFAIAREVFACSAQDVFMEPFLYACAILMPARMVRTRNRDSKAFRIPFKKRALSYAVIYGASFVIFKCLKDFEKHGTEKECDKEAASLGPEYLEGGIEFYEKTLSKNKALRKLMGSDGERFYDSNGNERFFFLPHVPLSRRLEFLQRMKKQQDEAVS